MAENSKLTRGTIIKIILSKLSMPFTGLSSRLKMTIDISNSNAE